MTFVFLSLCTLNRLRNQAKRKTDKRDREKTKVNAVDKQQMLKKKKVHRTLDFIYTKNIRKKGEKNKINVMS